MAICHFSGFKIDKKTCKIIIVFIWIIAFTIMIPWVIYYQLGTYSTAFQSIPMCYEDWPNENDQKSYFLGAIFLCCYSVPLVLIVACYFLIGLKVWRRRAPGVKNTSSDVVHRSKVKAVKMLAIVVLLFAFSWLPLYVVRLKMFYGPSSNKNVQSVLRDIINPIAQWLGSSNSGMNPIIYCFFSKRYRRGFKDTITGCCRSRENSLQRRAFANSMAAHSYVNGNSSVKRQTYIYEVKSPDTSGSDNNQSYV